MLVLYSVGITLKREAQDGCNEWGMVLVGPQPMAAAIMLKQLLCY